MVLARSTELDALNTMLSTIGVLPETGTTDLTGEPSMALNVLREVSRAVQAEGWHFNTEKEVTISPSEVEGYIELGTNVVRADQTDGKYSTIDVCQRGEKLYDRKANSFVFTGDVEVTLVVLLDWEDLPEPARAYIFQRASRIFKDRQRADNKTRESAPTAEEMRALATLKHMEGDTADHSIFDSLLPWQVRNRDGRGIL